MGARRYEVTRTIAASPATIWGLLADAASYPDWNKAVIPDLTESFAMFADSLKTAAEAEAHP